MKDIDFSKKEYKKLDLLKIPDSVLNTESRIYLYKKRGEYRILKELFCLSGETFANKLYTLEMLDYYKEYLPKSFLIPDSLASVKGDIKGFTIPYKEGINLAAYLLDSKVMPTDHLNYLQKVGEILNQLKNIREYTPLKDIYLNDLNESNFIVDPRLKSLTVVDLDSCKIANNVSFPARYLTKLSLLRYVNNKYKINPGNLGSGYVIADENSDIYCYVIIILKYLLGQNINNISIDEFYEYLNYLDRIGFNHDLLDCFKRIVNVQNNENPYNYLETLTDTQVYRARSNVYKLTKNRVLTDDVVITRK